LRVPCYRPGVETPDRMTGAITQSTVTCPECGARAEETMPIDACVHFYVCAACETRLRARPGDCCVFCSYGSVPCPSRQAEAAH
jgi:hypothetical protein